MHRILVKCISSKLNWTCIIVSPGRPQYIGVENHEIISCLHSHLSSPLYSRLAAPAWWLTLSTDISHQFAEGRKTKCQQLSISTLLCTLVYPSRRREEGRGGRPHRLRGRSVEQFYNPIILPPLLFCLLQSIFALPSCPRSELATADQTGGEAACSCNAAVPRLQLYQARSATNKSNIEQLFNSPSLSLPLATVSQHYLAYF